MRADFFGPAASTAPADGPAACPPTAGRSGRSTVDIRDFDAVSGVFADHADALELVIHTAAQPSHDWAALGAAHRLHRQRERHAQPARGDPPAQARRDVHLHLHQQGLRRSAEPAAARGARDPPRAAGRATSTSTASRRRCRSTAACTRCSASRRPRPTCSSRSTAATSACRRSASAAAASPGPNHAGASCTASSSYLMRCTVTGEPLHRLRLRRQAGARQHPQRRPRRGRSPRSTRARAPARSTTSAAAARATARCSRRSRSASRSPAASSTGSSGRTAAIGDHRWWISDLAPFSSDYPGWELELRPRGDPQRDPRAERRELDGCRRHEALDRHPGAQRGGLDRVDASTAIARRLDAEGVDYEILASTTRAATARER